MGFNDNLTTTQRIVQKSRDAASKIPAAQFSIQQGLNQANAILSDESEAVAVIESDIAASIASGEPAQLQAAGMAQLALADARLAVQQATTRLTTAKATVDAL